MLDSEIHNSWAFILPILKAEEYVLSPLHAFSLIHQPN